MMVALAILTLSVAWEVGCTDFIARFQSGIQLGNSNIRTVTMDEEAMVKALVTEVGPDTQQLLKVFLRLDDHYNSDVDDIAELYVKHLKAAGGSLGKAVAGNKQLVALLIKVMEEGFTTDGEEECIRYLKSL